MRTSCSDMFGLISVQSMVVIPPHRWHGLLVFHVFLCTTTVQMCIKVHVCVHVTSCVWPGVSGCIFCTWQCSNNPTLSQRQLIVTFHQAEVDCFHFSWTDWTGSIWGCGCIGVKCTRLTQRGFLKDVSILSVPSWKPKPRSDRTTSGRSRLHCFARAGLKGEQKPSQL